MIRIGAGKKVTIQTDEKRFSKRARRRPEKCEEREVAEDTPTGHRGFQHPQEQEESEG